MKHTIFVILLFLLQCKTSAPFKVNDNKIEKPLSEATGVTDEELKSATGKITAGGGGPDAVFPDLAANRELSLQEIFAYGVEHTERLAIRQEQVIQAESKRNQAKGSWIPSLSYRYTKYQSIPDHTARDREERQRQQQAALLTNNPDLWPSTGWPASGSGSSSLPPNVAGGSRLVLHVPIITGLNEYAGIKAGGKLVEQRKQELVHDAGRFYLELAQLYFSIIQLEREIKGREDIISLSMRMVKQLQQFKSLGKIKATDLLTAKSALARSEAEIQIARTNLNKTRSDLSVLTGVPVDVPLARELDLPEPSFSMKDAEGFINNRADILAARLNMEAARAGLKSAWGGHLPQVYIDNFYTLPSHSSSNANPKDITALLTFQFPLISGVTRGQITEAQSKLREAELNYKLVRRRAEQEIRQSYETWLASRKELEAYKKALEAAEENYKIQNSYYNRHLGTILDLITSLSYLSQSRNEYDHAMLQEKLNRIWVGVAVREFPKIRHEKELIPDRKK